MGGLVPPPRSTRLHLLLRAVRHRRRRWLHVQNCLAELHMMDIFLLRVKLGRVAEGGRSIFSSISLRSTVAPRTCYMRVDDHFDLIIGFYYPTLPLDELKTTLPPFPDLFLR